MSAINCIPLKPLSSWRPTNGETKVAPALAASSAWFAEKQSVTLTIVHSPVSALQVLSPSMVSGTFDRKRVVSGKRVCVRGDLGDRCSFEKNKSSIEKKT